MVLHWPQMLVLGLLFMGLGMAMIKHGEVKKGKENFWNNLAGTLIMLFVLYKGGFFN